jgi:Ser-tRNA(Ala) deacylase AlaX
MQRTERLHLQQPYLTACEAVVTQIHPEKGIATDVTVAFAEGGGQIADWGIITTDDNLKISFTDVQKGYGRLLLIQDFPSIQIDTPVYHKVAQEDLDKFRIGQTIKIAIDTDRRSRLCVSHTGIHVVLMGLQQIKPDIYTSIRGCNISPDKARLDFMLDDKFTDDEITQAREYTNQIIKQNWEAKTFAHPKEPEAMYWQTGDTTYCCGGTHLPSIGDVGEVLTTKKSLGSNMQRVSFTFPNATFRQELFVT